MVKRNSHWIPSAINRTQKHPTASIHNPARCLLSKMCLMLEMIERTPSSSILFSHMPTFSLKKLLRNHCSVAFAGKTSMSSSSGAMSVGNSGSFFLFLSIRGQGGCGHCPNGSAPGSCESSSGRLGHAGAPLPCPGWAWI